MREGGEVRERPHTGRGRREEQELTNHPPPAQVDNLYFFSFSFRTKYAGDNFVRTSGVIKDFAKTQSK